LGLVHHVLLLPVALLGIRFAGQGLMSHISQTVMGRYFEDDRGKALSLAALGYPVGEMIFPIIITLLLDTGPRCGTVELYQYRRVFLSAGVGRNPRVEPGVVFNDFCRLRCIAICVRLLSRRRTGFYAGTIRGGVLTWNSIPEQP